MGPHSTPYQELPISSGAGAGAAVMTSATPAPPATDRRSRRRGAREVSSRYMTTPAPPSTGPRSSSPTPADTLPTTSPKFAHHRPPKPRPPTSAPASPVSTDSDSLSSFADENQQINAINAQRRRVIRLFNDNNGDQHRPLDVKLQLRKPIRPATPMAGGTPRPLLASQKPLKSGNPGTTTVRRPAAAPGGKSDIESLARKNPFAADEDLRCGRVPEAEMCESPPINNCRIRVASENRSSMPEAELVPTMTVRRSVDAGSGRQEGKDNSPGRLSGCHRSLNSSLLNCQQLPFNAIKPLSRPPPLWKSNAGAVKATAAGLPPQWQNSVMGIEQRKGRKGLNRPEDVHPLRMLHNNLLQWRFANAKALAVDRARTNTAMKLLCEASAKISELRDSVALKRIQLEQLKREQNLITITEAQMPHLHEWAILEEDYSSSLSGAINALQDASIRLPVTSNVKADIGELKEALDPATHMLEALSVNAGKFMPQAEGLEVVSADLARVVSAEKALVEECGDLLSLAHILQVKECSLSSLNHIAKVKAKRGRAANWDRLNTILFETSSKAIINSFSSPIQ